MQDGVGDWIIESEVQCIDGGSARMYEVIYDPTVVVPDVSKFAQDDDESSELKTYIKKTLAIYGMRDPSACS